MATSDLVEVYNLSMKNLNEMRKVHKDKYNQLLESGMTKMRGAWLTKEKALRMNIKHEK